MSIDLVQNLLSWAQLAYVALFMIDYLAPPLGFARNQRVVAVLREVVPFAWLMWALTAFLNAYQGEIGDAFADTVLCAVYFYIGKGWSDHNDNDDDRWKRRRKRLTDAVRSVGSRLVVVPSPSPA